MYVLLNRRTATWNIYALLLTIKYCFYRLSLCHTDVPYNFTSLVDDEPPVFTSGCPSDIAIDNNATTTSVRVHWQRPTVADNSGVEPTVTSTRQSGDIFVVPGSYEVRYVAEDASGNQATCSFRITLKRKYGASLF